jgi:CO dehydrogenase/acetyl-CoA synthase epsilon subunit
VNGENIRYSINGLKSDKDNVIFFTGDLMNEEMVESFKKCSTLKIRVNESYCTSETYSFNMSKSTSALTYILNKQ